MLHQYGTSEQIPACRDDVLVHYFGKYIPEKRSIEGEKYDIQENIFQDNLERQIEVIVITKGC
jgi:hypothetical protein